MGEEEGDHIGVAVVSGEHELQRQTNSLSACVTLQLAEGCSLTRVSPLSLVRLAGNPAASGARKLSISPLRAKSKNWVHAGSEA